MNNEKWEMLKGYLERKIDDYQKLGSNRGKLRVLQKIHQEMLVLEGTV
ncbi:hypothetical protein ABS751_00265 [Bacillus subtilis]